MEKLNNPENSKLDPNLIFINYQDLENKLQNSLNNQKKFLDLIKTKPKNINKILSILPILMDNLGITFCALIIEKEIDYLFSEYMEGEFPEELNKIFENLIKIFNFKCNFNPTSGLKEVLNNCKNDFSNYEFNIRNNLTKTEILLDKIYSANEKLDVSEKNLQEISYIFNEIKNNEKHQKAKIEYFQEKINELIINKNINKNNNNDINNNIFKENSNNNNQIINNILKMRQIKLKDRTFFYKNEILIEGECLLVEFKNYSFPLNEHEIKELKRQLCGFLNSRGGRIYLGIRDDKKVKGMILDYKTRDNFRNIIINYTVEFFPICRDKLKIDYIPVKNSKDDKFISNLYVVKIIIYPGEPNILYSLSTNCYMSTIRLQGQCANLTAEEILHEINKRSQLKNNNPVNLDEFHDVEPEIYMDIEDININDSFEENKNIVKKRNMSMGNKKNKKNKQNNNSVFIVEITNIDQNLDVKEVNRFFNGLGASSQKFFAENKKSRGDGYLNFPNQQFADKFMKEYNHKLLGSKNIQLKLK